MSTFAVGEIALFVVTDYPTVEVTIIGPLGLHEVSGCGLHMVYPIDGPFGCCDESEGWCAAPDMLRKRRPPQDWTRLCKLDEAPVQAKSTAVA